MPPLNIYWSRRDFRLADNPALLAASAASRESGALFLPLFILEDYMTSGDPLFQFGVPSRQFLARALPEFAANFQQFAVVQGKAARYFIDLAKMYDLTIYVNDDIYIDFYKQLDKLKEAGVHVHVYDDALSVSKETCSGEGNRYSVFTPFKKKVWAEFTANKPKPCFRAELPLNYLPDTEVSRLPKLVLNNTNAIGRCFSSGRSICVGGNIVDLESLIPVQNVLDWYCTDKEALQRFADFLLSGELDNYNKNRDSLELDVENIGEPRLAYSGKTSRMSLALSWGLVSPRILMQMLQKHYDESFDNLFSNRVSAGALTFISELIWREFYRYQLFHRPDLMDTEFQKKFQDTIKWEDNEVALDRFTLWIRGETGYPVVDAAMKQIAETGWMHNRSRMIVASILTKNLGVDWRWGMEYFRAALIDLDEASNCGGWQWGASVGADPKPIRIFNPELQAKNYDASNAYQNHWLKAGDDILQIQRLPIIEHKQARSEALQRYGLQKDTVAARDY
jgi:deoxyribodipyrimidine photo-lyase